MPFARPDLETLIQRTDQEVAARLGLGGLIRRSILGALSRALAGAAHLLYGFLAHTARQVFPDTAERSELERWGTVWGVARKVATSATAVVECTGSNGASVTVGAVLRRDDGATYQVTASGTIASGTVEVPIQADEPGAAGSLTAGAVLAFESPLVGVASEATVQAEDLVGGTDRESDTDYRERILLRIQTPPQGGAAADYVAWALEVPGVTRAWVFPLHLGVGTVGLAFAVDEDPDGPIPDAAQVEAVQAYIDARRPVTAAFTAWAPTARAIDASLSITPDSPELRAAVTAALEDLFTREAEPGALLRISHVREAISTTPGEEDHELSLWDGAAPANVTFTSTQLGRLGTITWL